MTYQSCHIGVKCNSEKDDLREVKNAVIAVGGECSIHRKYREKRMLVGKKDEKRHVGDRRKPVK